MSNKANDIIAEDLMDWFKEPLTPEMRDLTREAFVCGWTAAKSGKTIEVAFDEFRGIGEKDGS